jgi:hypothetical protein
MKEGHDTEPAPAADPRRRRLADALRRNLRRRKDAETADGAAPPDGARDRPGDDETAR